MARTIDDLLSFLRKQGCDIVLNGSKKYALQNIVTGRGPDKAKMQQLHYAAGRELDIDIAAFDKAVADGIQRLTAIREKAIEEKVANQTSTSTDNMEKNREFVLGGDTRLYEDITGNYSPWFYCTKRNEAVYAPNLFGNGDGLSSDEREEFLTTRTSRVVFTYEPHQPKIFQYDKYFKAYNTYTPPAWKQEFFYSGKKPETLPSAPPECVMRHLRMLFETEDSVQYVLSWCAQSVRARNMCTLCIIGAMGTGKGILWELLESIHGELNTASNIPTNIFDTNFNSIFENKTFGVMNEGKISEAGEASFRQLIDSKLSITGKGKETHSVKNHMSFAIAANRIEDIRLQPGDRRMSIPDVRDIVLKTIMTPEELQAHCDRMKLPETVSQFAQYLMWVHEIKHNMTTNFKGEKWYSASTISSEDGAPWGEMLEELLDMQVVGEHTWDISDAVQHIVEKLSTPDRKYRLTKKAVRVYVVDKLPHKFKLVRASKTDGNLNSIARKNASVTKTVAAPAAEQKAINDEFAVDEADMKPEEFKAKYRVG